MSPSPRSRDHFPHIKDSFTYMTLVILQLYSATYVSPHLFISNISHVQSYQTISHPPLAHPILTRTTHTSHSHPNFLTLHSTLCYTITLPRSPTTHSPTLSSLPLRANRTHTLPSPSYLTPSPYLTLSHPISHPIQIHVLQRPRMNKTSHF